MAERRMFTKKITESDAFLEMPMSSQALYFHLCMNADDDGFVKNPKSIQRLVGCNDDDLKLLIGKRFVIPFESGIIVIKHWRMHNLLRKDRYKETVYTDERAMLFIKEDGAYTLDANQGKPIPKIGEIETQNSDERALATNRQPNGNQMAPQDRLGKGIDRERKNECIEINKNIDSVCAPVRESYEQIMDNMELESSVRSICWEFIKHCQLNGHTLTNAKLEDILVYLDTRMYSEKEKITAFRAAISGGYYDVRRG